MYNTVCATVNEMQFIYSISHCELSYFSDLEQLPTSENKCNAPSCFSTRNRKVRSFYCGGLTGCTLFLFISAQRSPRLLCADTAADSLYVFSLSVVSEHFLSAAAFCRHNVRFRGVWETTEREPTRLVYLFIFLNFFRRHFPSVPVFKAQASDVTAARAVSSLILWMNKPAWRQLYVSAARMVLCVSRQWWGSARLHVTDRIHHLQAASSPVGERGRNILLF